MGATLTARCLELDEQLGEMWSNARNLPLLDALTSGVPSLEDQEEFFKQAREAQEEAEAEQGRAEQSREGGEREPVRAKGPWEEAQQPLESMPLGALDADDLLEEARKRGVPLSEVIRQRRQKQGRPKGGKKAAKRKGKKKKPHVDTKAGEF